MYQTSIRNKKKISQFNKVANNNYTIDREHEEYAFVIKLLGNCRVQVLCDNGNEAIGVIRGSMRRFNKRVLIETGDIVAVSMREFQDNKVDIVHKYNAEQCKILINTKEISDTLSNAYNKVSLSAINNSNEENLIFDEDTVGETGDASDAISKKKRDIANNVDYSNMTFEFNSEDEDGEADEAGEAGEAGEADDGI
jgi:translation initiation factor 1A